MAVAASAPQVKVRRLAPRDLDAVVAIDARLAGARAASTSSAG
jgi:hypothetical protein